MYRICIPKYMYIMYMHIWETELTETTTFVCLLPTEKENGKR